MASKVDIINLALGKLAQDVGIAAVSDATKQARAFNRIWDPMRDLVLAERNWPWAVKSLALSLATEAPQPGWEYRYTYPNDCITAIAVTDEAGLRSARRLSRFCDEDYVRSMHASGAYDWETSYGTQDASINTDVEAAYLVYIVRVEDTGRYPAHFVDALAWRLAIEAAPQIIGEVGLNARDRMTQSYEDALSRAAAHAYNEGRSEQGYTTPAIAAREGG